MAVRERTVSVEQFWDAYAEKPFELVDGKVVKMAPTGGIHGVIAGNILFHLRLYIEEKPIGAIFGAETGFQLGDNLRGADAAFVSQVRWESVAEPEKFVPFAPDLAVEVVSLQDSAAEVRRKVDLYLANGSRLVWVIYPESRQVEAHYPDQTARTFTEEQTLDGGDVLPGLQILVAKIFPPRKG